MASSYSAAHKRYYDRRIKPFRKLRPPGVVIRCPACGLAVSPSLFEKPWAFKAWLRFGSHIQPLTEGVGSYAYSMAMEVALRGLQNATKKALKFLQWAVAAGLITNKEIASYFALQAVAYAEKPAMAFRPAMAFVPKKAEVIKYAWKPRYAEIVGVHKKK